MHELMPTRKWASEKWSEKMVESVVTVISFGYSDICHKIIDYKSNTLEALRGLLLAIMDLIFVEKQISIAKTIGYYRFISFTANSRPLTHTTIPMRVCVKGHRIDD